jgi:hypothetical protein
MPPSRFPPSPTFSDSSPIGAIDPAIGPRIEALKSQIAAIDERLNRIAKALQE